MATAIGTYAALAAVKTRLGKTDSTDDTLLTSLCDQVNAWIESYTGRPITPYTATYTFDGPWSRAGKTIIVPRGIRTITTLKIAGGTGQTLETITAGEYYLLPREQDRAPGWPATRVVLSDVMTSAYSDVAYGYAVAEIAGDYGWAAEPDEVIAVAETAVVRAWHARQAGQQDIIGTDETGAPIVSRYVAPRDRDTLDVYRWKPGVW
ncbi:MAG: phage head-tail connector protein [Thioalkalivibrio sp.]|nr:phage head-tail connector protein [Thioalkalivibrio sp.]